MIYLMEVLFKYNSFLMRLQGNGLLFETTLTKWIVKFYKGQEEHDGYIWDYYVNYAVKVEIMSKESSIRHGQIYEIFPEK